jgi:hypothetical protein
MGCLSCCPDKKPMDMQWVRLLHMYALTAVRRAAGRISARPREARYISVALPGLPARGFLLSPGIV